MPFVDPFEKQVVARLLDFLGSNTPWHRRLWASGIALTLEEVLEASHGVRAGALSVDTLAVLMNYASTLAGMDPGMGPDENKRVVQQALRKTMVPDSVEFSIVKRVIEDLMKNYLQRWNVAIASSGRPRAERTARCIASHLLDSGFSSAHLHRWCTFHNRNATGARSLAELIESAQELLKSGERKYKVLVGFHSAPPSKSGMPENWLAPEQASHWLRMNGVDLAGVRFNGAMLFHVSARDKWAAIQATVENVEHLTSRVSLGTDGYLRPTGKCWVERDGQTFEFSPEHRRVEVHALHRADKLYSARTNNIVDAAFDLVGSLSAGPASSAVASGWAAVEALLSGPGDQDVIAADRMGCLVACSFVRAELTFLSYRNEDSGKLAGVLSSCSTNRERAVVVASAITSGEQLTFPDEADSAALDRITRVLNNPYATLRDIRHHVSSVFERLYRTRNLVLHAGKTDAVGLRACLRTAGPLLGAGMDRIAHAWFVEGIKPMELVARAQMNLNTVGTKGGPTPVDLLL